MYVAKTMALISCVVNAQLICISVFAYTKCRFSHDQAHIMLVHIYRYNLFNIKFKSLNLLRGQF